MVPSNLRQKADESLSKKLERIVRLIRPALAVRALPTGRVRLPCCHPLYEKVARKKRVAKSAERLAV